MSSQAPFLTLTIAKFLLCVGDTTASTYPEIWFDVNRPESWCDFLSYSHFFLRFPNANSSSYAPETTEQVNYVSYLLSPSIRQAIRSFRDAIPYLPILSTLSIPNRL